MDNKGPIVVIGGGIIGSAIALELVGKGVDTTLIDRGGGDAASSYSFATITALDEVSHENYVLKCEGVSAWRRWGRSLPGVELRWEGEVRWADDAEGAEALRTMYTRARRRGYPVRPMTRRELVERFPDARIDDVEFAILAPEDGAVDPIAVMKACRERFAEAGGRAIVGYEATVHLTEDRLAVETSMWTVKPKQVVIASGAESAALAEKVGISIPLAADPGLLVVTAPLSRLLAGVAYVPGTPTLHLRQREDGRVLIGEGPQETVVANPTKEHARAILRKAARFFPTLSAAEIEQVMVAWRPMPADHSPIIGPVPGMSSAYLAIVNSGVTLAPIVARFVAQELTTGRRSERLDAFRPGRFTRREIDAMLDVEEVFRTSTAG